MRWLKNAWYVAAYSHEVPRGGMGSRQILNRPLVLWRNDEGAVVALLDRCPHRAAPLHMGRLKGNRIVCGYHGLEFDAAGKCVHNPHGSGAIPTQAQVRSFAVVERYGLIWVWTGDALPNDSLIPEFPMFDEASPFSINHPPMVRMNAPFEYVIDNLLDLSHASYLHEGLLGNEHMIDGADVTSRMDGNVVTVTRSMQGRRPPEYFDLLFKNDEQPADAWNNVEWRAPSYVLLDNGCTSPGGSKDDGGRMFVAHLLTPETEQTTLYHIVAARQMPRNVMGDAERVNKRLAELRQIAFVTQDDPMIRAQYQRMQAADDPFEPMVLPIDAGVVLWRRVFERLLKDEAAAQVFHPAV